MITLLRRKYAKQLAHVLLSSLLANVLAPLHALALTSGPAQPEFTSFQPVGTTDMVDKFSGDLNYSLPVLEVPGPQGSSYPLSLSYHSGASPEEEASWVGYGWTLNPGAIVRGTRGFPDDYNNDEVVYWNQVPKNWTATLGYGVGIEAFSLDKENKVKYSIGSLSAKSSTRYNNYTGFGYNVGMGVSLGKGIISLGYQETDGRHSYSARVNPAAILTTLRGQSTEEQKKTSRGETYKNGGKSSIINSLTKASSKTLLGGNRGSLDYDELNRSTQVTAYRGSSWNVSLGVAVNPAPLPIGVTTNLFGSYSTQENISPASLNAYGFMYSGQAALKKSKSTSGPISNTYSDLTISDYYTEKQSSYNKRDVFIGLPFNNADIFSVSGQGMGGVFKLRHELTGEFGPNRKKSETMIYNFSAEVSLGTNVGVGLDGGVGKQTFEEASWSELNDENLMPFSTLANGIASNESEGVYFKFASDLAADPSQAAIDDDALSARLNSTSPITASSRVFSRVLPSALNVAIGNASSPIYAPRQYRSSYIGYHTNGQMNASPKARYCKRTDISNSAYAGKSDKIGEFSMVNESGKRFTYGLPLYAANEKNLQYGVQGASGGSLSADDGYIIHNGNTATKIGEKRVTPYASTYLLTETVTPDYIDRTLDGPSADDFGGYTKFHYSKTYSLSANSFHWRSPYTGNVYQRNSLSDPSDDMGAVSEGDKEIAYLTGVQTKTHTAVFRMSPRDDGYDAFDGDAARTSPTARGSRKLQRLDAIDLYANTDIVPGTITPRASAKPVKTVNFRYSYELCTNLPNSKDAGTGKLTLKKVWFDYQGIEGSQVNPYEFEYQYPTATYGDYTAASANYTAFGTEYNGLTAADQNPGYAPTNTDAWGNYQYNAAAVARFRDLKTWLNQAPDANAIAHFDPAAWQLKVIRLPSKAEIHVQYEQDDYTFVQNRGTQALASLANVPLGVRATDDGRSSDFYVDPASVGLTTAADIQIARDSLVRMYVGPGNKNKIYCKFLYSLIGSSAPQSVYECNSDYISGYVTLRAATVETVGTKKLLKLSIGDPGSDYSLPWQVCEDFVKTQRLGKLSAPGNCNPAINGIPDTNGNAKQIVQQLVSWMGNVPNPNKCAKLNPSLSYFKIPLPKSKKGGGVRVKRLLTYAKDPALDNEKVLYGSEFLYKLSDSNLSSGVAINEPGTLREENPLVRFIPRLGQTGFSKFIAGEDRKQSEGPLGESVLPAASVGYSRVIEKNIHSGRTNPGFSVVEFFTAKDHPVRYDQTPMQRANQYEQNPGFVISSTVNKEWVTQGFSVILNNMHGQLHRMATYAGDYANINALASSNLITEQVQEYFTKEGVPPTLWNANGQGSNAPDQLPRLPGRDVEMTMAQHAVSDYSFDASAEYDFTVGFAFVLPIPFLTMQISVNKNDASLYSHATTKVVRYPAIVKSTRTLKDGITHLEENLALERQTGKPVAVRSGDELNGTYLTESSVAPWIYPEKRSKALNEGVVLGNMGTSTTVIGTVVKDAQTNALYLTPGTGANACNIPKYVRKGDLIALNGYTGNQNGLYNLYTAAGNDYAFGRIQLFPIPGVSAPISSTLAVTGLAVMASGNTNELSMNIGSTTYHQPKTTNQGVTIPFGLISPANSTSNTHPFVVDFNQQLNTSLAAAGMTSAGASKAFSLTATYDNMDVSGFYSRVVPLDMRGKLSDATVRNLNFLVANNGSAVKCILVSFELVVAGSPSSPYTVR